MSWHHLLLMGVAALFGVFGAFFVLGLCRSASSRLDPPVPIRKEWPR